MGFEVVFLLQFGSYLYFVESLSRKGKSSSISGGLVGVGNNSYGRLSFTVVLLLLIIWYSAQGHPDFIQWLSRLEQRFTYHCKDYASNYLHPDKCCRSSVKCLFPPFPFIYFLSVMHSFHLHVTHCQIHRENRSSAIRNFLNKVQHKQVFLSCKDRHTYAFSHPQHLVNRSIL